ncbi:hypothetical protein IWZ00DRAFT_564934, partial [Phyllosticta capitalensis]
FLLPALPTDILVVLCPTVLHPLCSSSTPTKEGNPESRTLETLPCTDNHKGPYRKKYLVRPKKAVDEVTYGQWSVEVLRDLTTDDSSRDEGPNEEMRAKLPYLVINSPEYIRWRPINDNVLTAFREFRGIKDFTKAGAKSADIVNEQITVGGKESVTAQRCLGLAKTLHQIFCCFRPFILSYISTQSLEDGRNQNRVPDLAADGCRQDVCLRRSRSCACHLLPVRPPSLRGSSHADSDAESIKALKTLCERVRGRLFEPPSKTLRPRPLAVDGSRRGLIPNPTRATSSRCT